MFFSLDVAPQTTFAVSSAYMKTNDETIMALKNNAMTAEQSEFFWQTVFRVSSYLQEVEPRGHA